MDSRGPEEIFENKFLSSKIINCLKLAGLEVSSNTKDSLLRNFVVCVVHSKSISSPKIKWCLERPRDKVVFLVQNDDFLSSDALKGRRCASLQWSYSLLALKVLNFFFTDTKIESDIRNFEENFRQLNREGSVNFGRFNGFKKKKKFDTSKFFANYWYIFWFAIFVTSTLFCTILFFEFTGCSSNFMNKKITAEMANVRAEMILPNVSHILKRPSIVQLIEKKLKTGENLSTVVLLGMSGGKKKKRR